MSHIATVWAYQQRVGNPAAKAVLVALADKASDDGTCFPGQKRIARMTELGERTVRTHIQALERAGLISRDRRHLKDGRRTSDSYVLALGQAFIVSTDQELPATPAAGTSSRSERALPATPASGNSDHRQLTTETSGNSGRGSTSYLNRQGEPSDMSTPKKRGSASRFTEFWQLYPRKEKRPKALEAWIKVTRTTDPETVLAGVRRYAAEIVKNGTERQHVAHPTSWLNAGRWEDDYGAPVDQSVPEAWR